PSEIAPLPSLRIVDPHNRSSLPPGAVNIINGYGTTIGQALTSHPLITKLAFTGSMLVGRKILKASSESNSKVVTLELGEKGPTGFR
ncbi:hypothetical protein C0989_003907, partial [Termitomyces sp. Mn162]